MAILSRPWKYSSYRSQSTSSSRSRQPAPAPGFIERKATHYELEPSPKFNPSLYPAHGCSFLPSLTGAGACQALLEREANYAAATSCEVFQWSSDEVPRWEVFDDAGLHTYLSSSKHACSTGVLRVFFVTLEDHKNTSYGCRLSLQKEAAQLLIDVFDINPHFCQFMFGKPDHWAPLEHRYTNNVSQEILEFVCQYPRWRIHTRQQPCSSYLKWNASTSETTFIVVAGKEEPFVDKVKKRLKELYIDGAQGPLKKAMCDPACDPFFLEALMCHESLGDAAEIVQKLRHHLYDQLDVVNTYEDNPFDRTSLRNVTTRLHKISQDSEALTASAQMLQMAANSLLGARARATTSLDGFTSGLPTTNSVTDTLAYLSSSIASQERWLRALSSRKDTAMNLVYNLVTQHDSETNTEIALATNNDSAVMRVIAILTMIFLPLSTVGTFFGMAFFESTAEGGFRTSSKLWVFAASSVPLTALTLGIWWIWWRWDSVSARFGGLWPQRLKKQADVEQAAERPSMSSIQRNMSADSGLLLDGKEGVNSFTPVVKNSATTAVGEVKR